MQQALIQHTSLLRKKSFLPHMIMNHQHAYKSTAHLASKALGMHLQKVQATTKHTALTQLSTPNKKASLRIRTSTST